MNSTLITSLVIFLAVFTQSLSGFGVALVAMAILPAVIPIQMATPLVALVAATLEVVLLLRYRADLNMRAVLPVALTSILGIPLGVWALSKIDERLFLFVLGLVIAGYALYALLSPGQIKLRHTLWAYLVGLLAGMLGGAYNTSGPPVIIYGHCRGWRPAEFKSNLQGFFLLNSAFVVLNHAWQRNLVLQVWNAYFWALPAMALGVLLGTNLDRYIDPDGFRKVVLGLLFLLGIRLTLMPLF